MIGKFDWLLNVEGVWKNAEECRVPFTASAAKLPRHTRPPWRHDDGAEATKYDTSQQFFRIQCFMVLDKIVDTIQQRFHSPAWKVTNSMERLLVLNIRGEELSVEYCDTVGLQHFSRRLGQSFVNRASATASYYYYRCSTPVGFIICSGFAFFLVPLQRRNAPSVS